jgi:hypothetical protein
VIRGHEAYYAVPGNAEAVQAFRYHVTRHWRFALSRRSQKNRVTWERMSRLARRHLPTTRIRHPWPEARFAASPGVQLIYTTGVKDPAAVIQFPNVIRLDNRQGGTQGRRYIVADSDGTDGGLITGVRVAHVDRRWDDPGAAREAAS